MNIVKQWPTYASDELGIQAIGPENQDALAECYLRIKKDGLLPILYQQGQPDLRHFLDLYLTQGSLTMICYEKGKEGPLVDFCGVGHVTAPVSMGWDHYKSEVSMVFFKGKQKRRLTVAFAHMMIEMAFDGNEKLTSMFGCTPAPNVPAVRFISAVGFERCERSVAAYTTWQGKPCGAIVSWMTREDWQWKRPFVDAY